MCVCVYIYRLLLFDVFRSDGVFPAGHLFARDRQGTWFPLYCNYIMRIRFSIYAGRRLPLCTRSSGARRAKGYTAFCCCVFIVLTMSNDQQVTRTRTRQQNKPLTRTQSEHIDSANPFFLQDACYLFALDRLACAEERDTAFCFVEFILLITRVPFPLYMNRL